MRLGRPLGKVKIAAARIIEMRELFHVVHMLYREGKKLFDDLLDEDEQ